MVKDLSKYFAPASKIAITLVDNEPGGNESASGVVHYEYEMTRIPFVLMPAKVTWDDNNIIIAVNGEDQDSK